MKVKWICWSLSHFQLFVTPWTIARQVPLSMGIIQTRILECIAIPFSKGSSQPRDWIRVSCTTGRFFTIWVTREDPTNIYVCVCVCVCVNLLQSCLTLWDSVDFSLPGPSVQGFLQARILEWVAIYCSRGSSRLRDWTHVSMSLALAGRSLPLVPEHFIFM